MALNPNLFSGLITKHLPQPRLIYFHNNSSAVFQNSSRRDWFSFASFSNKKMKTKKTAAKRFRVSSGGTLIAHPKQLSGETKRFQRGELIKTIKKALLLKFRAHPLPSTQKCDSSKREQQ